MLSGRGCPLSRAHVCPCLFAPLCALTTLVTLMLVRATCPHACCLCHWACSFPTESSVDLSELLACVLFVHSTHTIVQPILPPVSLLLVRRPPLHMLGACVPFTVLYRCTPSSCFHSMFPSVPCCSGFGRAFTHHCIFPSSSPPPPPTFHLLVRSLACSLAISSHHQS